MFTIVYKIQMPSGILIFEVELMITDLDDQGNGVNAKELKQVLTEWWESDSPKDTPEEACLGAWATITDYLVNTKQHPRVQCSEVFLETSGLKISFKPTEDTWSKLDV